MFSDQSLLGFIKSLLQRKHPRYCQVDYAPVHDLSKTWHAPTVLMTCWLDCCNSSIIIKQRLRYSNFVLEEGAAAMDCVTTRTPSTPIVEDRHLAEV
jgi:hypothetical protein